MKPKSIFPIAAMLAAGLPLAAHAIEAPEDDAPPPPAAEAKPAAAEAKPAVPAELDTAYLGVVASGVPAALADHLGLQPGEGVVVSALMPDGPAAKAGLAAHDVITRVAGLPVGSSTDLTREISRRKPGESIRLDVIHKSRPSGIDVTLGSRPPGLAEAAPPLRPLDQLNLDGIPHELADRVRDAIQGQIGELDIDFEKGALDVARQMEEAMREMKKQLGADLPQLDPAPPPARGIEVQQGATIRMMDDQGSVEIKALDGSKEVTVRDKDNHIVWNGPWDTEQDKAAAPADVRNRVDRLNLDTRFDGTGLRLRQVPAPQPDDP